MSLNVTSECILSKKLRSPVGVELLRCHATDSRRVHIHFTRGLHYRLMYANKSVKIVHHENQVAIKLPFQNQQNGPNDTTAPSD